MSTSDIDKAIRQGIDYLENTQLPHGEFKIYISSDPQMRQDCTFDSSLFGTAMIVYALSCVPGAQPQALIARALDFLLAAREKPGVWRYWTQANPLYPLIVPDLDDTCLISFLLGQHGIASGTNRTLIMANRNRQGLFYTWLLLRRSTASPHLPYWRSVLPRLRTFLPRSYAWLWHETEATPDEIGAGVNANVLLYLGQTGDTESVVGYLVDTIQQGSEATCDAYYRDPMTIYYLITRAYLHGVDGLGVVAEQITARVLAAWSGQAMPNNSLQTALGVCALLNVGNHARISHSAIAFLLQTQSQDGSWAKSPMWWGGPKRLRGFGSEALTTALCIEALARYRRASTLRAD